ncbi:MAG: PilW family protein [Acidobacteriota bacterium]
MSKRVKGFSFLEVLIVVAILSVVLSAIFGIAYQAQRSFDEEKRFTETSQHARVAMDEIVRYIRQAGNDPYPKEGTPFPAIEIGLGGNQITVRSDITGSYDGRTGDPDKALNSPMEDVTIKFESGTVWIQDNRTGGGFQPLADNIETPPGETFFKFYDSAGNQTTVNDQIVSVEVAIAAKTPPRAGNMRNTVTYRSHVFIRSKAFDVFATP